MSIFVWNRSCCHVQNHILKRQNALKWKFTLFHVIKNTIKQITFENWSESSIIFQSYLPTFLPNLRHMRPLSLVYIGPLILLRKRTFKPFVAVTERWNPSSAQGWFLYVVHHGTNWNFLYRRLLHDFCWVLLCGCWEDYVSKGQCVFNTFW